MPEGGTSSRVRDVSGGSAAGIAVGIAVGIAHHLGWAVSVATALPSFEVVDRRRLDLVEPGVPAAPVEHELAGLDDGAAAALVAAVRASVARATTESVRALSDDLGGDVRSLSLRSWPPDFPDDVTVLRRAPYASRADSIMYLQVLAEVAADRGWAVHLYDARSVEAQARSALGGVADRVLEGPRARLGPPWNKDHRTALAAAILALG